MKASIESVKETQAGRKLTQTRVEKQGRLSEDGPGPAPTETGTVLSHANLVLVAYTHHLSSPPPPHHHRAGTCPRRRQRRGPRRAVPQLKQTRDVGQLLWKHRQILHIHIKQMALQIWNLIPKEARVGNLRSDRSLFIQRAFAWNVTLVERLSSLRNLYFRRAQFSYSRACTKLPASIPKVDETYVYQL